MTEATNPPPFPAEPPRARPPLLTIVVLLMGAVALTSGVSVLWHDATCRATSCDQPNAITIGMIAWGLVAFLTVVRGPVGLVALIAVLISPLAVGLTDPWFFLFGLVILLGLIPNSKEQLGPYYLRRKEEA